MIFPFSTLNSTIEADADRFALTVMATARYDVYGASGALGKLSAITTVSALNTQFEPNIQSQLGTDMHTSLVNRLTNLIPTISEVCASLPSSCSVNQPQHRSAFPLFFARDSRDSNAVVRARPHVVS